MAEVHNIEEIRANIEIWCEALESGEYVQGGGYLERDDTFCCLGVACKALGIGAVKHEDGTVYYEESDTFAPLSLMRKLGLTNPRGEYSYINESGVTEYTSLVDRNDAYGWNFKQIADLIRSRPSGLFIEGM